MEPIEYPDVLKPYRITNPDATQTDSYISVRVGDNSESVPCMMILYANKEYDGGSFFNYLNIGFLALDQDFRPIVNDEGPLIYGMADVKDFFDQVGQNTQYIIHPEEIMADNFSFAILGKKELEDQHIPNQVLSILNHK